MYYYSSLDDKISVTSKTRVTLAWLYTNTGYHMRQHTNRPKKVTFNVIEPDYKIHWVKTLSRA